jgi:hypothetical protein
MQGIGVLKNGGLKAAYVIRATAAVALAIRLLANLAEQEGAIGPLCG